MTSAVVNSKSESRSEHGTAGPPMIEARSLSRSFGGFIAVDNVSFAIPTGCVVAFLGPNGAGKSTTMRLLTGYLSPSSGQALVGGLDVATDRERASVILGYLPENGPLYPDMTPEAMLRFVGGVRGLIGGDLSARIERVATLCALREVLGKPVQKLSRGYRQRVGMALALLHDPRVLILDEPTAGLDPNQVEQVRSLLRDLAKDRTVLLSTHILSEVRAVADRVLLISRGKLVHDGTRGSLGEDEAAMESRFRELTGHEPAKMS
ncbi:MAG: ATP-binding cassette domain-containing protein [Phycisphaerae bacterium]|nr:ATP-binding cassette domain-containing protein [Phycisphaerae bacterium]